MMKIQNWRTPFAVLLACALCVPAFAVESVRIVTTREDGSSESRTVQLEKVSADVTCLRISTSDMGEDTKWLDVYADNATAAKGDDGFWILKRGLVGYFNKDKGAFKPSQNWLKLPYYGMKTPRETFIAVIDGMRFEFNVNVEAKDGIYTVYPRWHLGRIGSKPYEDVTITYYTLPPKADYNDMAKAYRKHKFASDKSIVPIKTRMKTRPNLEQLAKSFPVRMNHAQKHPPRETRNTDYTPETEPPVRVHCSFETSIEILKKMKALGLDDVAVCVAGWQTGGYDGRCPATFPVCKEAGGEDALKKLIKAGQDMGYIMDAHSNYTDAFTCSPLWNDGDVACQSPDGKREFAGAWAGGRAYHLCLKNAWDTFLPGDLEKIAALGFRGAHYIDVFTAVYPYRCCDPKHPANRNEIAEIQRKIAQKCQELFGGFASECGFDHIIGYVDYINYVARPMRDKRRSKTKGRGSFIDTCVPFWELVYHDVVLSNPDKITQGTLSVEDNLKLLEFGGRPIFYGVNDRNLPAIKKSYEQFMTLRHLQLEEMLSHKEIADRVFRVAYGDGSDVLVNYTDQPFAYNGRTVKAKDFLLISP